MPYSIAYIYVYKEYRYTERQRQQDKRERERELFSPCSNMFISTSFYAFTPTNTSTNTRDKNTNRLNHVVYAPSSKFRMRAATWLEPPSRPKPRVLLVGIVA